MSDDVKLSRTARIATTASFALAVAALVILVVGVVVDDAGDDTVKTIGLGALLAVPLVRNVAIMVVDRRREALWALLGILLAVGLAIGAP